MVGDTTTYGCWRPASGPYLSYVAPRGYAWAGHFPVPYLNVPLPFGPPCQGQPKIAHIEGLILDAHISTRYNAA